MQAVVPLRSHSCRVRLWKSGPGWGKTFQAMGKTSPLSIGDRSACDLQQCRSALASRRPLTQVRQRSWRRTPASARPSAARLPMSSPVPVGGLAAPGAAELWGAAKCPAAAGMAAAGTAAAARAGPRCRRGGRQRRPRQGRSPQQAAAAAPCLPHHRCAGEAMQSASSRSEAVPMTSAAAAPCSSRCWPWPLLIRPLVLPSGRAINGPAGCLGVSAGHRSEPVKAWTQPIDGLGTARHRGLRRVP